MPRAAWTSSMNEPTRMRTPDRPERQDPPPRGRPPERRGRAPAPSPLRRARARPRARAHLPHHPARPVERPRRRARRRAGRRRPHHPQRYAVPHALLVDVADTMDRYGRLTLEKEGLADSPEGTRLVLRTHRPPGARGGPAAQEDQAADRRAHRRPRRRRAPERARHPQAGAAQGRLARRGPRRLRRRRGPSRSTSAGRRLAPAALPAAGRRRLLARRLRRRRAPLRRGQDPRRRRAPWPQAKATTLILVTNTVSARQWKDELLKRTTLTEDEIGEYSGARKEIRPVTIATYQVLTTRRKGAYTHLDLLDARDWGLIVYDEVHLLPGADLPHDSGPPGPSPARPHRDPRARGRPRGRRLQPHRPQALRRALEGHRGPGLHRARRLRGGAASPSPTPSGSPTRPRAGRPLSAGELRRG